MDHLFRMKRATPTLPRLNSTRTHHHADIERRVFCRRSLYMYGFWLGLDGWNLLGNQGRAGQRVNGAKCPEGGGGGTWIWPFFFFFCYFHLPSHHRSPYLVHPRKDTSFTHTQSALTYVPECAIPNCYSRATLTITSAAFVLDFPLLYVQLFCCGCCRHCRSRCCWYCCPFSVIWLAFLPLSSPSFVFFLLLLRSFLAWSAGPRAVAA